MQGSDTQMCVKGVIRLSDDLTRRPVSALPLGESSVVSELTFPVHAQADHGLRTRASGLYDLGYYR